MSTDQLSGPTNPCKLSHDGLDLYVYLSKNYILAHCETPLDDSAGSYAAAPTPTRLNSRKPNRSSGMFSHSYHHHQNRKTTPTSTHDFVHASTPDQLLDHHRHLESLLDSALATVTLINLHATRPDYAPVYSSHLIQVIHALNHLTTTHNPTPVETPTETHIPPTFPAATAVPGATYAEITTSPSLPTTHDPITTKHHHTAQSLPPATPPPSERSTSAQSDRVVIRFDLKKTQPTVRAHPEVLYTHIEEALGDAHYLAGVRWTQRGNLVLYPHPATCTAKLLLQHASTIWAAIRPLLGVPDKYTPRFESDSQWHSVVIHGAPVVVGSSPMDNPASALAWLDPDAEFRGSIKAMSVLCRPEELTTRRSVAVRVCLSSAVDAQRLLVNGACLYGAKCKVSRYHRRSSPSTSDTTRSIP
ncbi:hypothetical protein C8R47DRAFT_61355 [Mycena vitilis]|nr:hypothetical protein C8R47DRAFT_61355 [Mycena vitilis]